MNFYIAINNSDETGESQTFHVVRTQSDRARTNKRILREYFLKMGVQSKEVKRVMNAMGFTKETLGAHNTQDCD